MDPTGLAALRQAQSDQTFFNKKSLAVGQGATSSQVRGLVTYRWDRGQKLTEQPKASYLNDFTRGLCIFVSLDKNQEIQMENVAKQGKTAAIVAYFTIIGTIIAFFMNNDSKNPFASFHIRQALGIHITFYMLGLIISWFDSWAISIGFYVFIVVLWGYSFVSAIQGERKLAPILGEQYQKIFGTID